MSGGCERRFHFGGKPPRPDSERVWLGPHYLNESDGMVSRLAGQCPPPPDWAADLFQIARAVWLVDKTVLRKGHELGWVRRLDLSIALREPEAFQSCHRDLDLLLEVLTGDRWAIGFTRGGEVEQGAFDLGRNDVSEVALFSGGLDSSAYAADATQRQERVLLVSYAHNEKRAQDRVQHELRRLDKNQRLDRVVPFRQLPSIPAKDRKRFGLGKEYTSRSRGLLFIAAAVYAAAAYGVGRVAVPENGQLAVNPPLAPDRIGACCTRTAHPLSLFLMNKIIGALGGGITVENPWRDLTKAEVCCRARRAGLSAPALNMTVSCSKLTSSQNRHNHCGTCWACLVRRAALGAALPEGDPTVYDDNPWQGSWLPESHRQRDLAALRYWLRAPFDVATLAADIPVPASVSLRHLLGVIERGRRDLRDLDDREGQGHYQ